LCAFVSAITSSTPAHHKIKIQTLEAQLKNCTFAGKEIESLEQLHKETAYKFQINS
jgi:hypothetical protein